MLSRSPGRCSFCTVDKARDQQGPASEPQHWPSPRFPDKKELWHVNWSTPIYDDRQRFVGAVELSRPPTVGEVFAYLSPELLDHEVKLLWSLCPDRGITIGKNVRTRKGVSEPRRW